MRLVLNVDGGARGNPGPAAIGVVIATPEGETVERIAETIGEATNNVAEYRALLRGLERARELGAEAVELRADSELVVKQVNGDYRVRSADLAPLHAAALAALSAFDSWTLRHVPRACNAAADALVNAALDAG